MPRKLGQYFNYKGRRYYRIYIVGMPRQEALNRLAIRRTEAPQFDWRIRKESNDSYSLGRAEKR